MANKIEQKLLPLSATDPHCICFVKNAKSLKSTRPTEYIVVERQRKPIFCQYWKIYSLSAT
jgi:hypothetical protein